MSRTYTSRFDVDAVLQCVESVSQQQERGTPEDAALRVCAAALAYIRDELQKVEEFREFYRKRSPASVISFRVEHTFDTREAADDWLALGTARDGQRVRIEGQGYMVVDLGPKKGMRLVRRRLPDEPPPLPSL
ncbi:hypothetical protein [Melittangium boletus]|uniref:Uncharacterized protein n=1 Tax=Melittangium boletus DSM 14713 TaxID=1294270 RepID=A0A250IH80_9BACT|nr:hypothetical protein [Melittangium boletus]ATB30521.1 hypothetical protein MEBOL_003982 [Melittangium boletus DSM 14713]